MDNGPSPDASTKAAKSKKSVIFVEGEPEVLYIEEICELPVREIWFAADDYFDIKAKTRYDAKEWRKKGFGLLLKESFENPSEDTQSFLNAFCRLDADMSRRGMERHLSRKHGEERSDLKDRARYCVLSNQRRMRRQGMKLSELSDHLALIYHDATRPAKIFARRIALGDEIAARQPCNNAPAFEILDALGISPRSGKMERRLSNMSNLSTRSGSTYDSLRSWGPAHEPVRSTPKSRCPSSPATAMDECYAAMA